MSGSIYIAKGSGKLVRLPHPMANLFAADPSVVEVRPASPDTMFVFGKDLGQTTIVATDSAGTPVAQYHRRGLPLRASRRTGCRRKPRSARPGRM